MTSILLISLIFSSIAQQKTMQMMYEVVYKALMEVGLEDAFSPQDYLNFFCLGNREAMDGNDPSCSGSPNAENTPQVTCILNQ